jgi:hypothetical protein
MDWTVILVGYPLFKVATLPILDTKILPVDNGVGENTSLAKREC